jgi:hypothetical protein
VADTVVGGRGGRHLSMRRLVAEKGAAQGERSWTVRVENPGDINGSRRGFPGSSIAVRPKASRTLWTYGRSAGAIQIWNGSRSRVSVFGHATTHRIQRLWRRLSTDSSIRRSRRPCFVAAAASRPVRSCDNASFAACEVRAATSPPRSGGSGLYAPPRGHDQGRARGRWLRGAPVPLARLAG